MNELERWATFYLLTAAAAAQFIGLLFVVITLGAERRRRADSYRISIYLTPTVILFAHVLFLGALLTLPNHNRLTAILCICFGGVIGLVYSGSSLIGGGKKSFIEPRDRIPYAIFPCAACGLLVLGGVLILHAPQIGLTLVAAGMLLLLALAIRNSWAIAINIVSTPRGGKNSM